MPAPSGPVTLAEACRLALAKNGDFRSAQFQVDAALAQLKAAREVPNPTLGLSTAKISTDGTPENTALGNGMLSRAYDSIVSLSQLIQVSKRGLMRDSANAGVHVAQFQLDDARRLLLQAVTQSDVAALSAEEQAKVLGLSASALRREAEVAAHRYQAGDLSKSDQSRIEIAAEQDELGAASEEATAKAAVVALESLIGVPEAQGATALADTLGQLAGTAPTDSEQAVVLKRPDIAAAEAALEQADLNVRLARHQRVPDVTLSLQYERNPPAQPDTVGVGLSLPLPVWNQYSGEILGAMAARNQAEAHLERVRIQAGADVAAARVAYREAVARSEKYQGHLVPMSAEVTRRLHTPTKRVEPLSLTCWTLSETTTTYDWRQFRRRQTPPRAWPASLPRSDACRKPATAITHRTPTMTYQTHSWATFRPAPLVRAFAFLSAVAFAALGAGGCSRERQVEAPPEPKIEGETVTFVPNAPQLSSLSTGGRPAQETGAHAPNRAPVLERQVNREDLHSRHGPGGRN